MVCEVTLLNPYLQGANFTIRTDHEALRRILNITDAKGGLARSILRLSVFNYDFVHRVEVKHQAGDAFSRLETSGADTTPIDDNIPLLLMTHDSDEVHACYEFDATKLPTSLPEILLNSVEQPAPTVPEIVAIQA